jgi:hypothetical protein
MLGSNAKAWEVLRANELDRFIDDSLIESGQLQLFKFIQMSVCEKCVNSLFLAIVGVLERPRIAYQELAQPVQLQNLQTSKGKIVNVVPSIRGSQLKSQGGLKNLIF